MAVYFKNPANDYVEKVTGSWTWLWALLFGPFYLLYKGAWPYALVYLLIVLTLRDPAVAGFLHLMVTICFAFAIYPIVKTSYRRSGWIETTPEHEAALRRPQPPPIPQPALWDGRGTL